VTPRERVAAARLYVIAPATIRAGRLAALIPALAEAGTDIVQLRDRDLPPQALLEEARACAAASRAAGCLFIVNDDAELALAAGADGVHFGQADGPIADARAVLGPTAIVGRTTRGAEQLEAATAEGADYGSVSPVWPTATHPTREAVGLGAVAAAVREARIPWFALGGVDERRVGRLAALGAPAIAVVRAVTEAPDPAAVVRRLRAGLTGRPRVMTIAGSDSGGGAGIQADVKAIAAAGGFPLTAITALTAQNTTGVSAVHQPPVRLVMEQFSAVAGDIGLDGVKTGMLGTARFVEAVAEAVAGLDPLDEVPVVVDPVMRAEAGSSLLATGGEDAYRRYLLPRATVMTPNLFEARALAGSERDSDWLASALHETFGCAVIVTGGHGQTADDVLCTAEGLVHIPGIRLAVPTTHGAGCTHSATLAALLARGVPLEDAARGAKEAATRAVAHGQPYGAGAGPVDVTARD
jgi:hydroxymethylpyrimidine kinase / phosphomethylpyrimidine kinase / thiamine-phosphate diphosphorylase